MSIPVNDLHKGIVFRHKGDIYTVLEYRHKSIARGRADIKIKARNLNNGAILEVSFKSGQSVEEVLCHRENAEFVYFDERKGKIFLADSETKRRRMISSDLISEEQLKFLSEGVIVQVLVREDSREIVAVDLPITVELEVEQAPPAEKGDTASGGSKPVTLVTGAVIQVPMFIKKGDVIKVNTERGEYMERVTK